MPCVSPCQASKISRHVKAPLQRFEAPSRRFGSLHLDLVGPLPPSEGNSYLLTIVDRFTRWPTAIPIPDATAASCCRAFTHHWLPLFGVPDEITTDRGAQFTGSRWSEFLNHLGVAASTTTSYHPQANGMVERMHRQLKGALKARLSSPAWVDELPWVLLGLRSAWREASGSSPAEAVFGTLLRLPGEFLPGAEPVGASQDDFVRSLQHTMKNLSAVPVEYHGQQVPHLPPSLKAASHVYLRHDAHRKPLSRPYDGPFKVISRSEKYYSILKNGASYNVSVDRLKPAFTSESREKKTNDTKSSQSPSVVPSFLSDADFPPLTTRSGRVSRPPDRLSL